ncbi:hypothetical protein ACFSHQ_13265 [Gemmobacter lanyuensis]
MDNRDLMLMGGYVAGQDADLDTAVRLWPKIRAFLAQDMDEPSDFMASRQALIDLVGVPHDRTQPDSGVDGAAHLGRNCA